MIILFASFIIIIFIIIIIDVILYDYNVDIRIHNILKYAICVITLATLVLGLISCISTSNNNINKTTTSVPIIVPIVIPIH